MSQQIDPVAEKSSFLQTYMSNHPDTLVAYAKWYGNVQEIITSAEMTAIDSKARILFTYPRLLLRIDNDYPIPARA